MQAAHSPILGRTSKCLIGGWLVAQNILCFAIWGATAPSELRDGYGTRIEYRPENSSASPQSASNENELFAFSDFSHKSLGQALSSDDELKDKWLNALEKINLDIAAANTCRKIPNSCTSLGASELLRVVRAAENTSGSMQIGIVNRDINLAIKFVPDIEQYGVSDYWASPTESLSRGAGDCEDYAIAKFAVFRLLGVTSERLRLVIVRDHRSHQPHAILAVSDHKGWRLLDNRTMAIPRAEDVSHYQPLFMFGEKRGRLLAYQILPSAVLADLFTSGAQAQALN